MLLPQLVFFVSVAFGFIGWRIVADRWIRRLQAAATLITYLENRS